MQMLDFEIHFTCNVILTLLVYYYTKKLYPTFLIVFFIGIVKEWFDLVIRHTYFSYDDIGINLTAIIITILILDLIKKTTK